MLFEKLVSSYDAGRSERNAFHDLQRFRVREVLLVGSLYDTFVMESDGVLTEQSYGEYFKINLGAVPRITPTQDAETSLCLVRKRPFDMVVVLAGTDFSPSLSIAGMIKSEIPLTPLLLLVINNAVLASIEVAGIAIEGIDRIFVWNGYSKLFAAMIKFVEDLRNVEDDSRTGLVKVILLIEDSVRYYSRYLPLLYRVILKQTQALIEEERGDEIYKLLRSRSRPKVLLATDYESAVGIFDRYEASLLAVISDLSYLRDGSRDLDAGLGFLSMARGRMPDLPMIIQSEDPLNRSRVERLGASFADKTSESLEHDLGEFLRDNLGFGPMRYKDSTGRVVAQARNMEEFIARLDDLPAEILLRHAERDHFSTWLTARGEIRAARLLKPYHRDDFESEERLLEFIKRTVASIRSERARESVPYFDETHFRDDESFTRLGVGSVGGKGRGLAFARSLIQNLDLSSLMEGIQVKLPRTAFIGIDEFERFLELNGLWSFAFYESAPDEVVERFLASPLDPALLERLRRFIQTTRRPLAVRSSGLFEDMLRVSFSGIYETLLIPNCHEDVELRLAQLSDAIRLVYASLFSKKAGTYFQVARYKREEERMAIVLQEVVGCRRGRWYYPHVSGTAQSFNFYPVAYVKPEDGLCLAALGLGSYVVGGGTAFRFCPRYPKLDVVPPDRVRENSQRVFRAIDLERDDIDLRRGEEATVAELDIEVAEGDPRYGLVASTWDIENDRLSPGIRARGPRIIDLANILKHDAFPFAKAIDTILEIGARAMDAPVEIEYALNIDEPTGVPALFILQIKPLFRSENRIEIDLDGVKMEDCLIVSERSMGNGRDATIEDVLWVDPARFDLDRTEAIAIEIEELDKVMRSAGRRYLLAGPGRWGTRDHRLGVPVAFAQIAGARVIVEADLPGFQVESSLGSHFFHNVTSMNIGYFSVPKGGKSFVDWAWLASFPPDLRTDHCSLTHLPEPVEILMDGRTSRAIVRKRLASGLKVPGA